MPIIQSAIKRMRQNAVRKARRLPAKTYLKTMMLTMRVAAKEGKREELLALLPETYKAIDMAAKRNIIHKKNAARRKSAMAKLAA